MAKYILVLYTIILILISSTHALAATPPKFSRGQLKASVIGEYYSTDSNYEKSGGSFEKLAGNNELLYIAAKPSITYGLNNKWALAGDFTYAYGKSTGTNFDRTNGGITDASASLYYKLATRSFYLLPQLKASLPLIDFSYLR